MNQSIQESSVEEILALLCKSLSKLFLKKPNDTFQQGASCFFLKMQDIKYHSLESFPDAAFADLPD